MAEYVAGRGSTALGIIGTSLGGLAVAGQGLFNGIGGMNGATNEIIDTKTENAILKSKLDSKNEMFTMYQDVTGKINALEAKVDANASAQAVINCSMSSATSVLQTQVAGILEMTKLVIPSTNILTATTTS